MLAHASTFRLSVRKGKAEQRLMKVGRLRHWVAMWSSMETGHGRLFVCVAEWPGPWTTHPLSLHLDACRWSMPPTCQRQRPAMPSVQRCGVAGWQGPCISFSLPAL